MFGAAAVTTIPSNGPPAGSPRLPSATRISTASARPSGSRRWRASAASAAWTLEGHDTGAERWPGSPPGSRARADLEDRSPGRTPSSSVIRATMYGWLIDWPARSEGRHRRRHAIGRTAEQSVRAGWRPWPPARARRGCPDGEAGSRPSPRAHERSADPRIALQAGRPSPEDTPAGSDRAMARRKAGRGALEAPADGATRGCRRGTADGAAELDGAPEAELDGAALALETGRPSRGEAAAEPDGSTEAHGTGTSVGSGVKTPPFPRKTPLSRIAANTMATTIT